MLGPSKEDALLSSTQAALLNFYERTHPELRVIAPNAIDLDEEEDESSPPNFLNQKAFFHKYIVIDSKHVIPSTDHFHAPNAIIQSYLCGPQGTAKYVGQVSNIITHQQARNWVPVTLLQVQWLRPLHSRIIDTRIWDC